MIGLIQSLINTHCLQKYIFITLGLIVAARCCNKPLINAVFALQATGAFYGDLLIYHGGKMKMHNPNLRVASATQSVIAVYPSPRDHTSPKSYSRSSQPLLGMVTQQLHGVDTWGRVGVCCGATYRSGRHLAYLRGSSAPVSKQDAYTTCAGV